MMVQLAQTKNGLNMKLIKHIQANIFSMANESQGG